MPVQGPLPPVQECHHLPPELLGRVAVIYGDDRFLMLSRRQNPVSIVHVRYALFLVCAGTRRHTSSVHYSAPHAHTGPVLLETSVIV